MAIKICAEPSRRPLVGHLALENIEILKYGPFVMNTEEEILQTINDYRQEKNGFENAMSWNSFVVRDDPVPV